MKCLIKITGVLLLCVIVSCKKEQLESTSLQESQDNITRTQIQNSDWSTPMHVEKADRSTHTVYYTNLKAPDLSSAISDGLIRIYKKDNKGNISSRALPFEETNGSQKTYWYYEVSDGNIMVSADVYGERTNPFINNSFKYIVIDEADIQHMQTKGINKKELKRLSYEDLNELN